MSEELRPCPFCGGTKICTEKGINLNYCDNCSAESNIEHWNIRPIEDALNARIAELEGKLAELIEAGESMSLAVECENQIEANAYYSWKELVKDWKEREE